MKPSRIKLIIKSILFLIIIFMVIIVCLDKTSPDFWGIGLFLLFFLGGIDLLIGGIFNETHMDYIPRKYRSDRSLLGNKGIRIFNIIKAIIVLLVGLAILIIYILHKTGYISNNLYS